MNSWNVETCRHGSIEPEDGLPSWCRENVQSVANLGCFIQRITDEMACEGFPENEIQYVRLALEEAIVNANKHGHHGDWTLPVRVRYRFDGRGVTAQVEDEGSGFDPENVLDPLAPENLNRPSGRGLLLMRAFMTRVCHNQQGNCVCFCKHRSDGPLANA